MGDGLKYVFEVEGKSDGLDKTIDSLETADKLLPKIEGHTKLAASAHGKHAHELKGLEGAFDRLVHAGMDPFLHKMKEIAEFEFIRLGVDKLLEAPGEMIEKIKELGSEMIKASAHAERMDKSMELLFGKQGAEEHSEWLNKIRKVLPFTKQTLEDAGLSLARVGFSREEKNGKDSEMVKALAAAADMASFASDKTAGFFDALATLEKVKRTGDVEERALGNLGLGKKDFLAELSRETGEGIATLKDKLNAGKVDVEDSLNSLYTLILKKTGQKSLGGTAVEMGKLLDSRLTRLQDLPDVYMDKLADTQAHRTFSGFVDRLGKMLDPDTERGKQIFEAMEKSALSLVKVLDKIDIGHELMVGVEILEKLPRLIELSTRALEAFGFAAKGAMGPLIPALGGVVLASPAERVEMKSMANQAIYGKTTEELSQMSVLDRLGVGIKGAFKTVGGMVSAPFRDKTIGKGLADGMKGDEPLVHDAAGKLGEAAVEGTRKALDSHSPSRKFAELGRMSTAGYVEGIEDSVGAIDDVMRGAFAVPAPNFRGGRAYAMPEISVSVDMSGMHINGAGATVAEDIAQHVKAAIPDALLKAFEDLRAEQGT